MAPSELAKRFEELPPYQQKEMVQLVLAHAEISEENLRLEFFGQPITSPETPSSEHDSTRSEPCEWLPGQRAQSAILVWHTTVALRRRPWDRALEVA